MEKQESRRKLKKIIMGNPKTTSPLALRELFFDNIPESIIIKNKDYPNGLKIPKETLQGILSLESQAVKAKTMLKLFDAIQETTDLIINY